MQSLYPKSLPISCIGLRYHYTRYAMIFFPFLDHDSIFSPYSVVGKRSREKTCMRLSVNKLALWNKQHNQWRVWGGGAAEGAQAHPVIGPLLVTC